MSTTSISPRMVFRDPENPSFDPGQVLVIYESIDPESPCPYYAVYENVTWFNPRLKFTPFADRRKCYNNQFRLIEANAVALDMNAKKCIHVWSKMKYASRDPECMQQEPIGGVGEDAPLNHDQFLDNLLALEIPADEGVPEAFQVSLTGVSLEEVPVPTGFVDTGFWKIWTPQLDEFYKNKKWNLTLRSTESLESWIHYTTGVDEEGATILHEDVSGEYENYWSGGDPVTVKFSSGADFWPCWKSRDETWPAGWILEPQPPVHIGRVHIYIGVLGESISIDASVYMTGNGTVKLLEPVNCNIVSVSGPGSSSIGGYILTSCKLNVEGVRLEPAY